MSYDDPVTDEEWRETALYARGALLFVAAKAYGLVRGGPEINVPRCEELVARRAREASKSTTTRPLGCSSSSATARRA